MMAFCTQTHRYLVCYVSCVLVLLLAACASSATSSAVPTITSAPRPTVAVTPTTSGKFLSRALVTYRGHVSAVGVVGVAWSPDGKRIAAGDADGMVYVWDATTGKLLVTYSGHNDVVWDVEWSPDGREIASASQDGTAQVWQPE
jgi:WD40 repeat protein